MAAKQHEANCCGRMAPDGEDQSTTATKSRSTSTVPTTVLMPGSAAPKSANDSKRLGCAVKFKPFTPQEKRGWLDERPDNGFVRIYDPNAQERQPASIVVPCTLDTSCRQICEKLALAVDQLHLTLNGELIRRLDPDDRPLRIQNAYLANVGFVDPRRQQHTGDSLQLGFLLKFTAGRPVMNDDFGRPTLSCHCYVRKGRVFQHWSKRLCVLNSARLRIYPDSDRNATPDIILLSRAKVEDIHLRSRGRCVKITVAAPRRPVQTYYLAFDSSVDLNTWMARCLKGAAKVPPISDLSNLQLEMLPEQLFSIGSERLLTQLNLKRNCLKEKPSLDDSFLIGWLDDLPKLESLRNLNLADNDLRRCPSSLFQLNALTELILSGNKLAHISGGIGRLRNLQTLNLQNNRLTELPSELAECQALANLDLSFNRFQTVPGVLLRLTSLEQWTLSGNDVSVVPDEGKNLEHVRKIELRRCKLVARPTTRFISSLTFLTHLDIRDNLEVTSLDLRNLHCLKNLCCHRCNLYDLQLNGTALSNLFASKNNLHSLIVMPAPKNLKAVDVSHNCLNSLPEWLTEVTKIEKIIANNNRLYSLPERMFTNVSSLKTLVLHHNCIATLPVQVENCFIELLDLHHNKLVHIPDEFLASAHKLKTLNLSQNLLTELPPLNPFLDLNKVQYLFVACNRLDDSVIPVIADYRRLRVLDLSYNLLNDMDERCVEKLQMLESVNLSGNRLQQLPQSLASLPNLAVLRAHSNRLTWLPDFSECSNLKVLDCASNMLDTVDVKHLLSPQLKHLDISCNANLRLDTSAFRKFQFDPCCSSTETCTAERLVSLIDMNRENNNNNNKKTEPVSTRCCTKSSKTEPPWVIGFSETSGERNKLCISQIRLPTFGEESGALFGIVDGGLNNELPQLLAANLPNILEQECCRRLEHPDYMKYALLSGHLSLQSKGQKIGASCALCHLTKSDGCSESLEIAGNFRLNMVNCGHTEAMLCRKGRPMMLTRRFLVEDANAEEADRIRQAGAIITEENEVNGITPCSRLLGCNFLYPALIPDPHVCSVDLNQSDEFLLMASRGLWEVMDPVEVIRRVRKITNPILAAKHLQDVAQSYGYKENLSVLVIRFFFDGGQQHSTGSEVRPVGSRTLSEIRRRMGDAGRHGPPIMSAMHVADGDSASLTDDDDVKSEPQGKPPREQPNYYFEYKKQLKMLMRESSEEMSQIQESLYSVATLTCDDRLSSDAGRDGRQPCCLDDGYQSSDFCRSSRPMRLPPDISPYASVALLDTPNLRRFESAVESVVQPLDTSTSVHVSDDSASSTSTCSSGLGNSNVGSPAHQRFFDEPLSSIVAGAQWKTSEQQQQSQQQQQQQQALSDAKVRFHQARQSIMQKLNAPDASVLRNNINSPQTENVRRETLSIQRHQSTDQTDRLRTLSIGRPPTPESELRLTNPNARPKSLIIASIDIDGTGPKNVVICDPDVKNLRTGFCQ